MQEARGGGGAYIKKSTRILRNNIQRPAQRTKRPPMDTMTMRRTHHLRACRVDRRMDHERRGVEQPVRSAGDDLAFVVNLDQVRGFD